MMTKMMLAISLMAAVLASGCKSTEQSLNSAYATCDRTGLRPGTLEYRRCTQTMYAESRQKADEAATAVALGVAAGAIGAIAISQASKKDKKDRDRYYHERPRRPRDRSPHRPIYPVHETRPAW
jgi:outer membrane lipoprotein SlyB